jgi:hypothetical protein
VQPLRAVAHATLRDTKCDATCDAALHSPYLFPKRNGSSVETERRAHQTFRRRPVGRARVGTEPVSELPTSPRPAAERMRLHRERRWQGLRCLMIELCETEIDAPVSKGLLKMETRNDARAIREALYGHLDRALDAM